MSQQAARTQVKKYTWIEVDPLPKLKSKTQIEREDEEQKIVQTVLKEKSKEAAPNAYLGEQTQKVDRQTVSVNKEISVGTTAKAARPKAQPSKEQLQTESRTLSKFGIAVFPSPQRSASKDLSDDAPNWANGESLSSDYIKGLKESETTALNTREYVFYGYFQRIRQRLDLAWHRTLREDLIKLYKRGRQLASDMDHRTRTLVTLNARGEIVRIQVLEESGTHDLDEAAIKAFNQAGPFPNPPRGIVDKQGLIQIRWEFVLRT